MRPKSPHAKLVSLACVCVAALCCSELSVFFTASALAPQQVLKGHESAVTSLAVSPDGRLLASASLDRTVRLWDARTGKLSRVLRGHGGEVYTVAFSPNGERLASSSYDGRVLVWDVATGKRLHTLTIADWSIALDFSADSRQLAVGSENRNVTIFDAQTGRVLRTLETTNPINALAISPSGRYLAVGYRVIEVWDLQTSKIVKTLRQTGVTDIVFSPDSSLIASGSGDKSARIWNVEAGEQLKKLETDTPLVWHLSSGTTTVRLRLPVRSVAFSPDGKTLAMTTGRTIHLWDVASGDQVRMLEGHAKSVTGAAFLPDGNALASVSLDGTIRIWPLKSP